MPLERGSRFGRHGTLGQAAVWDCPNCGEKQIGRRPEDGCGSCGVGTPAHTPPAPKLSASTPTASTEVPSATPLWTGDSARGFERVQPETHRIYRLIEYTFQPGASVDAILRRSLIGRMDLGAVAITGCIVDDLTNLQQDRLKMARMQPGVWSGKQLADEGSRPVLGWVPPDFQREFLPRKVPTMTPPTTIDPRPFGFSWDQVPTPLLRVIHLGLIAVLEELPTKPSEEYLSRAQVVAIISEIEALLPPEDAPVPTPEDQERRNAAIDRAKGAPPTPIYVEPEDR